MTRMEACNALGLGGTFTEQELKRAYRRKAGVTHPDMGGTSEAFNLVNSAYEYLRSCSVSHLQVTHKSLFNIIKKGS